MSSSFRPTAHDWQLRFSRSAAPSPTHDPMRNARIASLFELPSAPDRPVLLESAFHASPTELHGSVANCGSRPTPDRLCSTAGIERRSWVSPRLAAARSHKHTSLPSSCVPLPDRSAPATPKTPYRVRPDGTGLQKEFEQPILIMGAVSPDKKWLVA